MANTAEARIDISCMCGTGLRGLFVAGDMVVADVDVTRLACG